MNYRARDTVPWGLSRSNDSTFLVFADAIDLNRPVDNRYAEWQADAHEIDNLQPPTQFIDHLDSCS